MKFSWENSSVGLYPEESGSSSIPMNQTGNGALFAGDARQSSPTRIKTPRNTTSGIKQHQFRKQGRDWNPGRSGTIASSRVLGAGTCVLVPLSVLIPLVLALAKFQKIRFLRNKSGFPD